MKEDAMLLDKMHKSRKLSPSVFIVVAIIILIIVSREYFSFLDEQLFKERKNHIVEFTDKASEIVETVIDYSWWQLNACEHVVKNKKSRTKEELLDALASTADFIDKNNAVVLAIDEHADYYASDNSVGRWPQTQMLTAKAGDTQQVVSEIPHKKERSYLVFIERIKEPIIAYDSSLSITHFALAIDIEALRDKISVKGFDDQCYTYLINEDGKRLYKYTYTDNFIEGYNVLNAFEDYKIVHGGTYEDFVYNLGHGKNTSLEFEFIDSDGSKQNWFVANAAVSTPNLQILLFVPTQVLGVDTTLLMNRTIRFFAVVLVIFMILSAVIVVITMISRADKQLMQQKDELNHLLKVSADEARSANQAKSDFLSHMSHDIRTPINGIMGMTDIALKNVGNQDKIRDCLSKISGSSQHLLGLINDVLDMTRIESGKTKMNHEKFDIRACIENCASIIDGQLTMRDLELVKEFSTFEHPHLIGDELHLRQIFINILGNSVKFTPDGGKIYFRVQEKESTDNRVLYRFELEDTGIGMKAEFLPHLFEPFAQEDDGTRTTYKGTGLGMAITKKFADLMGATLEVESQLNIGTKFVIELWSDIDPKIKQEEHSEAAPVSLEGMKVLLVDDIELNLEIAQNILEDEGIIVTSVMNGQEAVDKFSNNPEGTFDLIIMDIMMPVMDGIAATKTIRAMKRPDAKIIPIIALTANAYEEDIRSTHEAGMNEHLPKPIDVDKLLKTIAQFYHKTQNQKDDLKGMTILLADDVELNLEIAVEMLEEMGADTVTAKNGQEAVAIFSDSKEGMFDAILMDVHMPVMDGLLAAKTIRAMERSDAKKVPIIALTADVYEEDIQNTKEAGMDDCLAKPLNMEKLFWLLSKYCV